MIGYVHVTLASLIASTVLGAFGTVQPARYDVDGIRVDFGVSDGQIDPSSESWPIHGQTTDETEEWAIELTLSDDFTFSSWISTVDFQVNGLRPGGSGHGDVFFGFGDGSKYISMAVDQDGRIYSGRTASDAYIFGISIYPPCGGAMGSGSVSGVLSNSKKYDSDATKAIRKALSGGDWTKWTSMGGSEHNNGKDVWPVTIEVTNNVLANTVTVRFESATQDLECVYDDLFERDTNLVFGINPDTGDDALDIHSITVAKSEVDICDGHCDASAHIGYAPMMNVDAPESGSWSVELSGKDMLIAALCAINMVVLIAVICSCSRSGGAGLRKKRYAVVPVNGDSEMEQFQN